MSGTLNTLFAFHFISFFNIYTHFLILVQGKCSTKLFYKLPWNEKDTLQIYNNNNKDKKEN